MQMCISINLAPEPDCPLQEQLYRPWICIGVKRKLLSEYMFLQVVDETDRMLRQSYQDWLPYLTASLAAQQRPPPQRVVRVVVSATLTRDPSKVERLGLYCPRYIAMTSQDHRSVTAAPLHLA